MSDAASTFRHEAIFYEGLEGFEDRTVPFLQEGIDGGEPIFVVVSAEKIQHLRHALGTDAEAVRFADMATVGKNPARIIPAWAEFVRQVGGAGTPFRGIGEPIFPSRSPEELVECERHEALLNVAFAGGPAWRLACPYDTTALPTEVLDEARRNHPSVWSAGGGEPSSSYRTLGAIAAPFDRPLPEPIGPTDSMSFDDERLVEARHFVGARAAAWGLPPERVDGLVLAASEIATNTIRHGGGDGVLRMWSTGTSVICEVADHGSILDPLVGRRDPGFSADGGFGMWLANQMCDLVQVRTFPEGSVVRLHVSVR
jgi:anti-sigma regulatory factor (Ser/Thr protein kinase)